MHDHKMHVPCLAGCPGRMLAGLDRLSERQQRKKRRSAEAWVAAERRGDRRRMKKWARNNVRIR